MVDGVVIGVRTAIHDKPRLTVRLCSGSDPARIVIGPHARLPDDAIVLGADGTRRILVQGVDRPRAPGVEVLSLPSKDGRLDPASILEGLRGMGLETLLIEGGGLTITGFLEAGLLDRLHVAIAPLLIGAGPQGLTTMAPVQRLADAIRPQTRVFPLAATLSSTAPLARWRCAQSRPCIAVRP